VWENEAGGIPIFRLTQTAKRGNMYPDDELVLNAVEFIGTLSE
jgi:hypothetical protein